MFKFISKNEGTKIIINISIETLPFLKLSSKARVLSSALIERFLNRVHPVKFACKRLFNRVNSYKFKLKVIWQVLKAKPQNISLQEENARKQLVLFVEENEQKTSSSLIKNLGKMLRITKEKSVKGAASISILALILQTSMLGFILPAPSVYANGGGLCAFAVDAVLLMDTTGSMDGGSAPSKCEWKQYEIPYCVSHIAQDVTEEWCSQQTQGIAPPCNFSPVYTPATPKKIDSAKASAKSFIDKLGLNDQSALVSFNNTAVLEKNLSNDHVAAKTAIDALTPQWGTGTNIGDAIGASNAELSERGNPLALKVMILLTDGKDSNTANVEEKTQQAAYLGYKIFTIGLGSGINAAMLQNIAETTDGKYHYAASQNDLDEIYEQISQEICQFSDSCQLNETPKQCVGDGQREHNFTWNYSYCGENYTENAEDETCDCQTQETDRNCVDDSQAEVFYHYNFDYCGQDYSEIKDDLACSSEYQCGEWENTECVSNGTMEQTRTCTDQYENSYEETRQISDDACGCASTEVNRTCSSDGLSNVSYSWNYGYCGEDYSTDEADANCGCLYTDWQNEECSDDGFRRQIRSQTSQFEYCTALERNNIDSSCSCQETETSGECVSETQREYTFSYNFAYCQQKEPELRDDPTCAASPEPEAKISGCKYKDLNNNGEIDEREEKFSGWTIILQKQNNENWEQIATTTTSEEGENQGCYTFTSLQFGNYRVSEDLTNQTDWVQTYPQNPSYWEIALNDEQTASSSDFANYLPVCGNSILDNNEECDDGNTQDNEQSQEGQPQPQSQQPATGGGGGGAALPLGLTIQNDSIRVTKPNENSITITWLTSHLSTSQVVYSSENEPHIFDLTDNIGNPPKYGYSHTTPEYDVNPKVTFHSVTINDLTPGPKYYYRLISRGSFAFSSEYDFTTLGSQEGPKEESENTSQDIQDMEGIKDEVSKIKGEIEKVQGAIALLEGNRQPEIITFESPESPEEIPAPTEEKIEQPAEIAELKEEVIVEKTVEQPAIEQSVKEEQSFRKGLLAAIGSSPLNLALALIMLITLAGLTTLGLTRKRKIKK